MKAKKYWIIVAAALLAILGVFTAVKTIAQEEDKAKIRQEFQNRLMDSNGVFVYVDVMAQDKSEEQSMTEQLQKDVESQLKQSNIKILAKDQLQYAPGRPRLAVYLVTFKEPMLKNFYIYSFRIVHFEDAALERNYRYVEGICWDSGLYVGREKIADIIKTIRIHVNKYIQDYLAANPPVN
jgi:uncharacterized protein YneF (UPF0154 family)